MWCGTFIGVFVLLLHLRELDARARKFDMCVRVWTRVFGSLIHASGSWIHVSGSWICVLCYPVVRQIFFRLLSLSDPVFFV